MKIALIAPTALPSRRASAIQTIRMAQAFARLGHEVLLLAYAPHPQPLSQGGSAQALRAAHATTPSPSPTGRGELGIVLRAAGAFSTALRSNNDVEKRCIYLK